MRICRPMRCHSSMPRLMMLTSALQIPLTPRPTTTTGESRAIKPWVWSVTNLFQSQSQDVVLRLELKDVLIQEFNRLLACNGRQVMPSRSHFSTHIVQMLIGPSAMKSKLSQSSSASANKKDILQVGKTSPSPDMASTAP